MRTVVTWNSVAILRATVPLGIQLAIADRVPDSVRDWVVKHTYLGRTDWAKTPAFAVPSGSEGFVRLNLVGREANGVLDDVGTHALVATAREISRSGRSGIYDVRVTAGDVVIAEFRGHSRTIAGTWLPSADNAATQK